MHVMRQELVGIRQDLEPSGALHKLISSAPGFSTAHHRLCSLDDQCAAFVKQITAPDALQGPVPDEASSRKAQAASDSFSAQLEAVIQSVLLWAQTVHKHDMNLEQSSAGQPDSGGSVSAISVHF